MNAVFVCAVSLAMFFVRDKDCTVLSCELYWPVHGRDWWL